MISCFLTFNQQPEAIHKPRDNPRLLRELKVVHRATELRYLGQGSFGQVFEIVRQDARDDDDNRRTVVKIQRAKDASDDACKR